MSKRAITILLAIAATLVTGGIAIAAAMSFSTTPAPAYISPVTRGITTVPATRASTATDVKGNCDEAEHANDPECAGPQEPEDNNGDAPTPRATQSTGDDPNDISGPCDEAEHANDPRCTGASTTDDSSGSDDRSGSDDSGGDSGSGSDDSGSDDSGSGGHSSDD